MKITTKIDKKKKLKITRIRYSIDEIVSAIALARAKQIHGAKLRVKVLRNTDHLIEKNILEFTYHALQIRKHDDLRENIKGKEVEAFFPDKYGATYICIYTGVNKLKIDFVEPVLVIELNRTTGILVIENI